MTSRTEQLQQEMQRVDGVAPGTGLSKHKKMTTSPFVFYRGSAPLFYADLAAGRFSIPKALLKMPLTTVMGDCHTANFGFFSEEGSHGDRIIFAPNDFDDACIGHAAWDLARFCTSVYLCADHCQGMVSGRYHCDADLSKKAVVTTEAAQKAVGAFLKHYLNTCHRLQNGKASLDDVLDHFNDKHILKKRHKKAIQRAYGGDEFKTKSSLAKAVELDFWPLTFRQRPDRYQPLSESEKQQVRSEFEPYVDDRIVDIVQRLDAGTGSVNMDRYYLLVGPDIINDKKDIPLYHVVEVKQQRQAAPLHHFPGLNPSNRLNPAHLTVMCQRRMQRNPDLVLDDAQWQDAHWLVRSRHHARVGIDPEHIGVGKKAVRKGFGQYAKSCGQALALAHARGDRRSHRFERAVCKHLPDAIQTLSQACADYADQVKADHQQLCQWETLND